jgi:hypothetical protein
MLVHFLKSGRRHYGVLVERTSGPAVIVEPAPGYDDFLPHDLLHFVAEAEWGLDGAVFGQLAAGGDPGLFVPVDEELLAKWLRSRKLRRKSRTGGRRSEAISAVLDAAWRARTGRASLTEDWDVRLAAARVEPKRLEAVLATLDDLARRWHRLQIGGSLTLEWPRPEGRRHPHQAARSGRVARRTARRVRGHRLPR